MTNFNLFLIIDLPQLNLFVLRIKKRKPREIWAFLFSIDKIKNPVNFIFNALCVEISCVAEQNLFPRLEQVATKHYWNVEAGKNKTDNQSPTNKFRENS